MGCVSLVKIVKMVWAAGVRMFAPTGNDENGKDCEHGMGCRGVGCLPRVKLLEMVKLVKIVLLLGYLLCSLIGNDENYENYKKGIGRWCMGCVPPTK